MKKIYAIIAMSLLLAGTSSAQVKFGLKGGLNLTEISVNQSDLNNAIKNKSGFFVGPTVKFTLPFVGLGIDAAALYDQRKGELKATGETLKQQSIQVPINARYAFGLGDFASFFIFAGPQFGFSIGNNDKIDWSLKKSHVSGNAGLGVNLANHLQLTANYNFALSKSAEYEVIDLSTGKSEYYKVKNNAWQIALAYYF